MLIRSEGLNYSSHMDVGQDANEKPWGNVFKYIDWVSEFATKHYAMSISPVWLAKPVSRERCVVRK